ncbi:MULTISPECIES: DUF4214 domain-containing protein [unclassified Chelatococcus]|uniref:DUF4214 domain-containing protein n=1 Tax=unclassified Chelatococcus TaxID=2638111 RepID=UPI001BCD9098|nr:MULTISPECIES: DUF4214 domain-containing protein [unclassified Chelatococcus]MBS7697886.1 DUF4214 domain-containing protein [Chelatococcus sp. YT9]MBX3558537.1 DUF4214 domain-containing protein [Chelatococcus sp.]
MSELIDNVLRETPDSDRSQSSAWHARAVQAVRLYQITFNRVPDRAGLDHWTSRLDGRQTFDDVATRFVDNPEFNALYRSWSARSIYQEFLGNALGPDQTIPDSLAWKQEFSSLSTGQLLAKLAQASEINAHLKPYIGVFLDGLHNGTENYTGSLLLRRVPTPSSIEETGQEDPTETPPSPALPPEVAAAPPSPPSNFHPADESVDAPSIANAPTLEEAPGNAASADRESVPDPPSPLIQNPNACLAPGDDGAANPPSRTEHVISSSYQPFFGTPYSDFIRATSYVISSNTERPQVNSSVLQRSTVNGCAGYDVLALEMSETVIDSELVNIEELWVRAALADPRGGLYAEPAKDGAIINGYGFGELQTLILDSLPFRLKVPNLDSDVSVHIRNAAYSTTLNFGPARSWGSERDVRIAGMASDLHVNGATWLKLTFNGAINGVTSLDAPSLLSLRVIGETDATLDLSPATVPKLRFVNATELAGRLVLHHERGSGGQEISQLRVDGSPAGNDFSWYGLRHIFITAGDGADVIRTDLGNDTIYAGGGRNTIFTGPGYDRIVIENAGQSTLSDDHDNMTVIGDFDAHSRDKIAFSFLKHADFASSALLGDIQNAIDALPPRAHLKDAYFKATEIADGCGWFAFKGNTYIFVDNAEHTLVKIVGLHNPVLAERTFSDPWTVIM